VNPMTQQASPPAVGAELRKAQALNLRLGGATYRQIADALGVDVKTAHGYVTETMAEIREHNVEKGKELKEFELQKLDTVILGLWPKKNEPRVADTILRYLERRHKLIGLDAPVRWEGSGPGGGPIPVEGSFDLRNLTTEELVQLMTLQQNALARGTQVPESLPAGEVQPPREEQPAGNTQPKSLPWAGGSTGANGAQ
jgi:hypothetical protein